MADVSRPVLTPRQVALLGRVREALDDLRVALARTAASSDDDETLRMAIEQLEDFFLLVIVGEFNAGKSALINALLGAAILAEGVTPTTTDVQILRHSEQASARTAGGLRTVTADAPLLRQIHLVDTPGTNAITRAHEALTERFVPRADLILFVTSADRPFTESERRFMEQIRQWGKKIVIVINKIDMLASVEDRDQVQAFVRDNVRALLGFPPEVFAVSARDALAKKTGRDAPDAARFEALEHYILNTLNDEERFRLKLLSPLGVGLRLLETYAAIVAGRLDLLREDAATVEHIATQLAGYRLEMTRVFRLRLAEVDNLLHQAEQRGDEFFEETVRVGRLFDLMNKSRIRLEFER
jgi:small GTP-binding protein